jgi:hypothetical protein
MRTIVLVLLCFAILGCSYHSQSKEPVSPLTYTATLDRRPDSTGKLRRLALMPVELEPYSGEYASKKDEEAGGFRYQDACAGYLTEKKGYQVVVVRDTVQDWYREWKKDEGEDHAPRVVQEVSRALNVDGVVVVRIKGRKPWGTLEGLMNIALINIPLFYRIGTTNIGAWIYEGASGRVVWQHEVSDISGTNGDAATTAATTNTTTAFLIGLFTNLENAVPRQLVE